MLEFAKMTGAGNDFIVIDDRTGAIGGDAPELAKQLCRRRLSIGADGLITLVPSSRSTFRMRYFNADGSEADMCGNGGRCAAMFAHRRGMAGTTMSFESRSGLHRAEILSASEVRLAMSNPRAVLLHVSIHVAGERLVLHRINTGVPHAVLEIQEGLAELAVVELGRAIRGHPAFLPEGTNADFVTVADRHSLELRTYERGVEDETLACGTGAVAAALVMAAAGRVEPPVVVTTRSGFPLTIGFYQSDLGFCDVTLAGDARIVYEGRIEQSSG